MAMIDCPECSKSLSDTAAKCIHCGFVLKKPKRSALGQIFKWTFIAFNLFMVYALFTGLAGVGELNQTTMTEAEQSGAEIGTAIGVTMIFFFWVLGDIILGIPVMLTRAKA